MTDESSSRTLSRLANSDMRKWRSDSLQDKASCKSFFKACSILIRSRTSPRSHFILAWRVKTVIRIVGNILWIWVISITLLQFIVTLLFFLFKWGGGRLRKIITLISWRAVEGPFEVPLHDAIVCKSNKWFAVGLGNYTFLSQSMKCTCIHFNVNFIDLQSNATFCFSLDPDAAISINASTSATISWMSPSKLAWKRLQSFLALRSSSSTFFTLKMNIKFTIHVLYILQMWKNFHMKVLVKDMCQLSLQP